MTDNLRFQWNLFASGYSWWFRQWLIGYKYGDNIFLDSQVIPGLLFQQIINTTSILSQMYPGMNDKSNAHTRHLGKSFVPEFV
jgi:hypothetical protein